MSKPLDDSALYGVVIPCYQEGNRLPVADFLAFYERNPRVYFLFVNDGSQDHTAEVIGRMITGCADRMQLLNLPNNQGKGEAVRQGLLACLNWQDFEAVGFFDADLATPLDELFLLANEMRRGNYLMAFGSRLMRVGSVIKRNALRHYFGRVFATLASAVIPLPVYDTQCGAKLLRPAFIKVVCQVPFMSRWLFDLEIFARGINHYGLAETEQRLIEVPLRVWVEKGDSRLKINELWKVPFEMWRIHQRYFGDK
jgi:dolichyl-phosphate beta-glucosyltransferase